MNETDRTKLGVGMRVRPIWAAERTGALSDIEGFELVAEGEG